MAKRKKTSPAEMRKLISSLRGKYKPKLGEKSGLQILMEERAKDKIHEEEKIQRFVKAQALHEDQVPYRVNGNHPPRQLHCIDLFAGCGGLSLGLEEAGFKPLLFSEINPQAAETYIANRVGMGIIPVGDVYNLTDLDLNLLKTNWSYNGVKDIDLVCGGPPCQGYSGIGHRRTFKLDKQDIPSNHLFQEMVRVIRCVRPRMFMFENVRGLLNARWTPEGQSGEIFKAVLDEFKSLADYRIRWDLVHAKNYGVPQNRPRVIMVGIRYDVLPHWVQDPLLEVSFDKPSAVESGFLPKPSGTLPALVDLLNAKYCFANNHWQN